MLGQSGKIAAFLLGEADHGDRAVRVPRLESLDHRTAPAGVPRTMMFAPETPMDEPGATTAFQMSRPSFNSACEFSTRAVTSTRPPTISSPITSMSLNHGTRSMSSTSFPQERELKHVDDGVLLVMPAHAGHHTASWQIEIWSLNSELAMAWAGYRSRTSFMPSRLLFRLWACRRPSFSNPVEQSPVGNPVNFPQVAADGGVGNPAALAMSLRAQPLGTSK